MIVRSGECSIALIGMPGAGKSTLGVLLAKHLGLGFVDTDILIQQRSGRRLQEILDVFGYRELRRLEEEAILALEVHGAVIATGGSAVYSDPAMRRLRDLGVIVYLEAGLGVLTGRIGDFDRRGIANPAEQSLEEIFRERAPLYASHADATVKIDGLTHDEAARAVIAAVRGRKSPRDALFGLRSRL